jgi:O-antigen/teichoic acid export membrane protein
MEPPIVEQEERSMKEKSFGASHDPLAFVVAVWLLMAPFFLGFPAVDHVATIVMWIAAVLMFMSANDVLVVPGVADEWLDAALGVGVFASPWLFGYSNLMGATLNALAAGSVIMVCALLAYGRDHDWHWHMPGKHG